MLISSDNGNRNFFIYKLFILRHLHSSIYIMVRLCFTCALFLTVAFAQVIPCPDRPKVCCKIPREFNPITIPSGCKCRRHRNGIVLSYGECPPQGEEPKPCFRRKTVCCSTLDKPNGTSTRNKCVCEKRRKGTVLYEGRCTDEVCKPRGPLVCCKINGKRKPRSMYKCSCELIGRVLNRGGCQ